MSSQQHKKAPTTAPAMAAPQLEGEAQQGDWLSALRDMFFGGDVDKDAGDSDSLGGSLLDEAAAMMTDNAPAATIESVSGTVECRGPDTSTWHDARPGERLYRGWRVNTHERSSAAILFADGSSLTQQESSLTIVYGATRTEARRETHDATMDRDALRDRLGGYTGG